MAIYRNLVALEALSPSLDLPGKPGPILLEERRISWVKALVWFSRFAVLAPALWPWGGSQLLIIRHEFES